VHGKERRMTEYVPIHGFYDLREYDLPKKIFQKLWNIQEYLNHVNERREYFKMYNPIMWRKAQELSADYQRVLFAYEKKPVQMDLITIGT
jgi:hypothetical protein